MQGCAPQPGEHSSSACREAPTHHPSRKKTQMHSDFCSGQGMSETMKTPVPGSHPGRAAGTSVGGLCLAREQRAPTSSSPCTPLCCPVRAGPPNETLFPLGHTACLGLTCRHSGMGRVTADSLPLPGPQTNLWVPRVSYR